MLNKCYTIIFVAISLPIATLDSLILTITLPPVFETTVTIAPTTKPRFSRKRLVYSLPPTLVIVAVSPSPIIDNGIISLLSVCISMYVDNVFHLSRVLVYTNAH